MNNLKSGDLCPRCQEGELMEGMIANSLVCMICLYCVMTGDKHD